MLSRITNGLSRVTHAIQRSMLGRHESRSRVSDRRALHLETIFAVGLTFLDFVLGQFARMDRIAAGVLATREIVRHRLHFENMKAAEFGDLFERQAGVVDEPGGGRMRHQRFGLVGHEYAFSRLAKIEGRPSRDGRYPADVGESVGFGKRKPQAPGSSSASKAASPARN